MHHLGGFAAIEKSDQGDDLAHNIRTGRCRNTVTLSTGAHERAYRLVVNEETLDATTAASRMFGRVPRWIRALMAMRNCLVAPLGLKTGRDKVTTASRRIGIFPVITETPERMVLGLDDRHLDFRVAIEVIPLGGARRQVTATTLVCTHTRLGRAYLAIVLPFIG
jgi:Protein of unknown function (DUF2867)